MIKMNWRDSIKVKALGTYLAYHRPGCHYLIIATEYVETEKSVEDTISCSSGITAHSPLAKVGHMTLKEL